jgi:hypothetical protein
MALGNRTRGRESRAEVGLNDDKSLAKAGKGGTNGRTKSPAMKNFLDALAAVLAGNAIYYLAMPHLPDVARHGLFREDWGLVVDFAICCVIFGVVKYMRREEE